MSFSMLAASETTVLISSMSSFISTSAGILCFRWFRSSSRLLVKDQASVYCHFRLRGVLPVVASSLMPFDKRWLAASSIDSRVSIAKSS